VGTLNFQASAQAQQPKESPHCDPNDDQDYQWLEQCQEALLGSMKEGGSHEHAKHQKSSKGQMRVPASFMSICVRSSICTSPLTQKPLKISRQLALLLLARPRGT
jgi:hypothetical protein